MAILEDAGVRDVEGTEMAVTVTHPSFEEWWEPYLHGVGPVGESVAALGPVRREQLQRHLPGAARVRSLRPHRRRLRRPRARLSVVRRGRRRLSVRDEREAHAGGPGYAGPIMTRSLLLRCRSEA